MKATSPISTAHLETLGQGNTVYRYENPDIDLLETFDAPFFDGTTGVVTIDFPELTSLCPVTGQPDFGRIVLEYLPSKKCVESKSFKLYMGAYRNHQSFMEAMTAKMCQDFVSVLQPVWLRVCGIFNARGGTHLHAFATHGDYACMSETQATIVKEWIQSRSFLRTGGFNI